MVSIRQFRELALSFPETQELPHFDKASFRFGKKIFATLDEKNKRVSLKLSEIDQDVFSSFDKSIIYPVPNKWGKQGWTIVEIGKVKKEMLVDVLTTAFCKIAPIKIRKLYMEEGKKL